MGIEPAPKRVEILPAPKDQVIKERPERFTYIDALRGIAALGVMVYHFIYSHLNEVSSQSMVVEAFRTLASYGHLGVEVFFVLSGFVISYSIRNASITPRFFGAFALRRSLRLDPPYWFVILISYIVTRLSSGPLGARAGMPEWLVILLSCTYLNRMVGSPTIVAVGWTMCQEVQFYLVFVVLMAISQKLNRLLKSERYSRLLVFGPLAAYSIAIALSFLQTPLRNSFFELWHLFFAGVIVSWVVSGSIPKIWAWFFLSMLALMGCVFKDARMIAAAITGASILIVAAQNGLTTFLNVGILQYFGRVSYSLYLIHPLVGNRFLRLAMRWTGSSPSLSVATVLFAIATCNSILAAHFMYRFVEKPSLLLAKRVSLNRPR